MFLLFLVCAFASFFDTGHVKEIKTEADRTTLITKNNQTVAVLFYAPWCGHCKMLKPHFSDAANELQDMAVLAAINCDDKKEWCSRAGVTGYPTLKIYHSAYGKYQAEIYQGERTLKGLLDAIQARIPNKVEKVSSVEKLLSEETPKIIILKNSTKPTHPLIKNFAILYPDIKIYEGFDKETQVIFKKGKILKKELLPNNARDIFNHLKKIIKIKEDL